MTADPLIKRINIGVTPDFVESVQQVMIRHNVGLADAVHRLVYAALDQVLRESTVVTR